MSTLLIADRYTADTRARAACLWAAVEELSKLKAERLVLDLDETVVQADNRTLIEATRHYGTHDRLRYEHRAGRTEPLLALPDAIAWAWARGGQWRRRVERFVEVRRV